MKLHLTVLAACVTIGLGIATLPAQAFDKDGNSSKNEGDERQNNSSASVTEPESTSIQNVFDYSLRKISMERGQPKVVGLERSDGQMLYVTPQTIETAYKALQTIKANVRAKTGNVFKPPVFSGDVDNSESTNIDPVHAPVGNGPPPAKQWEYKIEISEDSETMRQNINRLGDEGWELVGVTEKTGRARTSMWAFLKRPKD